VTDISIPERGLSIYEPRRIPLLPRPLKIALLADASHVNCQRWCEGLQAAGADVQMISFSNWSSRLVPVHQLPIGPLPGKSHYFIAVPHTRRLLRRLRPDIVLAYYVTGYGMLATLAGARPLVQVTSGSDVLVAPQRVALRAILRLTLSKADFVTAWESHMAQAARQFGVSNERLLVLPRGIPYEEFSHYRATEPSYGGSVKIISTRSLRPNYNIDRLVKAAQILRQDRTPCSFTIAGDGPCRESIMELAQTLGVDQSVTFTKFVPNDRIPNLLAHHDLYVSLIESDGVSASLLEAMAVGLLPVVPDHVANRAWIKNGENGVLLRDLSPTGIAAGLRQAVTDLSLRKRAWDTNRDLVRERADLHRNSAIYVKTFYDLVARRAKTKPSQ